MVSLLQKTAENAGSAKVVPVAIVPVFISALYDDRGLNWAGSVVGPASLCSRNQIVGEGERARLSCSLRRDTRSDIDLCDSSLDIDFCDFSNAFKGKTRICLIFSRIHWGHTSFIGHTPPIGERRMS